MLPLRWVSDAEVYKKLTTIRIFKKFRKWKSFRCWRKALSRHKFQSAKQIIQERHFINYTELRRTYCEIQDVLSGISDMGMIEVGPTRTYTLAEFCQEQEERIQKLDTKLLEFRNLLRETVYDACRSTFSEAGFNADDYGQELEDLKRVIAPLSVAGTSSLAKKKETEEGKKKISFIEQANKRKECDKLAAYILSIDLMLNSVLHQLVVNSMTTIQDSISQRLAGAEEAKQKAKTGKKKKVQANPGDSGGQGGPPALFVTEVDIFSTFFLIRYI